MNSFENLSLLIAKQAEVQNKLLELEKSKTDALVKGDIERLDEIMKLEQPHMMNSANIEKNREAVQKELGIAELSLSQIVKKYDSQNIFLLKTRYDDLFTAVSELKKVNHRNIQILNSRINMVSEYVALLGLKEKLAVTYEKDGHVK